MADPIKVAFIGGGHPFDVPAVHGVFHEMPEAVLFGQDLQEFVTDCGDVAANYDVVIFHTMYSFEPSDKLTWPFRKTFDALQSLGRPKQGLMFFHHGMLAFPKWSVFDEMVGMTGRIASPVAHDETMNMAVAGANHPTTHGLPANWTTIDETYKLPNAELLEGNQVLLTTDHPESTPAIAWARQHGQSRVVTYLLGHDRVAVEEPNFRKFMHNTVRWLAGRE